ncbi:hypothetical protein [Ferruginibacter albus]|uniref:hypothetical protein n=1 Tax=Ferruginibacter albus TaxID=2875540 RepID=UPI001CC5EBCC|nr:hypothetical protein [Ferruginibacter albus]UAY52655.1 hypothetical protein K9M53_02930 [Ferruginibacter albus]
MEENKSKLPGNLNALTILTFIGCAVGLIFTLATPYLMKFSLNMMNKAMENPDNVNAKQMAQMQEARPAMEAVMNNSTSIIIVGIIGIALCFIGALNMRKLKKDGFIFYVLGQIIPLVGSYIILGKYAFSDWKSFIGILIPIVFIVLYANHRKYMVN